MTDDHTLDQTKKMFVPDVSLGIDLNLTDDDTADQVDYPNWIRTTSLQFKHQRQTHQLPLHITTIT